MTHTLATLMALALLSGAALAEGGKNRLGDEDITEGYQLCTQQGVETVVIEEDGITVIIDCEEAPGPAWPGAESDD